MNESNRPLLQIIIGSIREGRIGLPIAEWFAEEARRHAGFEVEILDLAEIDLPLMTEPNHPKLRKYTQDHTKAWSETISRGDAYVFVVPEYNHGITAPLKNALDYLVHEWSFKPVGIVSYGGPAGGTRAVQALKPTLGALKTFTVLESVIIPMAPLLMKGEGAERHFEPTPEIAASVDVMLDEMARIEPAMRSLRTV